MSVDLQGLKFRQIRSRHQGGREEEQIGMLIRDRIRMGVTLCPEARVYAQFVQSIYSALGERPNSAAIDAAKLMIFDRFARIMDHLPANHNVAIAGFAYPFHQCLTDVLLEAYQRLCELDIHAISTSEEEGISLGFGAANRGLVP